MSHNFMGLFVSDEHADYLKRIAVQYVKQVSSALGVAVDTYEHLDALGTCFPWCTMPQEKPYKSVNLEPHVKSLHITLAYHFDVSVYDALKELVDDMRPYQQASWELRLYSRDPRFANYQVYKVTQGYEPKANDELELVLGDYIYIKEEELSSTPDGWLHGTSWLTGVSGYLPAVYTRRTAESDAWTLHRAISLANNNSADCKSESDSNTDGEMANYPHENAAMLGFEKSEETYKEWDNYWNTVKLHRTDGILNVTHGSSVDWKANSTNGNSDVKENEPKPRYVFAMRHGERVDLTYGHWVQHCFDKSDAYVRKDLNMPLKLGERAGGKDAYAKDTPLTRVGRFQAQLVGEGLRLAGTTVRHVYASAALRCVETAHEMLQGLQADESVKVRVEPGLFEYKGWHMAKGLAPFMTPQELVRAGYNVDLDYKPYVEVDTSATETIEEFYERNEKVMQSAVKDTEAEGGNVIFVGHASTLDMTAFAIKRLDQPAAARRPYQLSAQLLRVPYCALATLRAKPWRLVSPPCPPSINSSSGRFDWKILEETEAAAPQTK